ncbi:MAG: 50S ribosomal protein L19e [Candidatus Marsarchaeota archaeon]|nr:50S ribosomal protein L19e [Candidatus Marsarchaeota archaeon]MCL5094458.1 50S ribosomal protein L19e [Candidatus Marsarchaeota archaeon]
MKLVKRIAKKITKKGINKIKFKPIAIEDIKKALTREDVKKLIKDGNIIIKKDKHNLSFHSKVLKYKRKQGRSRGPGRRKGTKNARGVISYMKKIRAQRRILKKLKNEKMINNELFKSFNKLVKGNIFATKISLLNHIKSNGVNLSDEKINELKHI